MWFGRLGLISLEFETLKILFVFFIKKKKSIQPIQYSHIKSIQKYIQSHQKTTTKSIQISRKLHKKIGLTCSHKSVQKTATKYVQKTATKSV